MDKRSKEENMLLSHTAVHDEHVMSSNSREESCDSTTFWQAVLLKQFGVKSKRAQEEYVGCELYPHLIPFARTPEQKKALLNFLKMKAEKATFQQQRDCQRNNLKMRLKDTDKLLQNLANLQTNGKHRQDKEVDQLESEICESLQIPSDFWPSKTANFTVILDQLGAFQKQICMDMQTTEMNDAEMVIKASGSCALQGILLTTNLDDRLKTRQVLLKVPECISLMAPSHFQHVITKQFESQHDEDMFTDTVNFLGYSVAEYSMVNFIGNNLEVPSVCSHIEGGERSEGGRERKQEGEKNTRTIEEDEPEMYSSTVQYFVMPLASCWFNDDQLQLSDDAIEDLKSIEGLIDSHDNIMSLQTKCKKFFQRFGSHVSQGPLHFGGIYQWIFYTSGFKHSEKQAVQQLQKESILNYVGFPVFQPVTDDSHSVRYDGKDSGTYMKQSFIVVATLGGPQGIIGLPGWKNQLIASNKTWSLIDRGTTLVPVWDIIIKNHKDDFKKPYSLATMMNQAWNAMSQCNHEQGKQDPVGNVAKVIDTVTFWNSSPDRLHCKERLRHLGNIKQNIAKVTMRPQVWPTVYLSHPEVQKFLKSVVDYYIQQTSPERRLPEAVKVAIKDVIEPIDLDAVQDFSRKSNISRLVYYTERSPIPMDCKNMMSLHKYFEYALEHMQNYSREEGALLATQPGISVSVTKTLAQVVHCFINHLKKTGQRYEVTFVVTMLLPFRYDPDHHVFLTSLSYCDLKYMYYKFGHHCKAFFEVVKQQSVTKSQAYLFSLALEIRDELHILSL